MKFFISALIMFATTAAFCAEKIGDDAPALDSVVLIKNTKSLVKSDTEKITNIVFEEGKIYVVEFWASWCGPCRNVIPHVGALSKQYADSNVVFIGVSMDANAKAAYNFAKNNEAMTYPVIFDARRKVSDAYFKPFGVRGIPHAFIIDGKGKLVWHDHPMNKMEEKLKEVINASGSTEGQASTTPSAPEKK